jgi:hypothetical protein
MKNQFADGLATIKDFYDQQREMSAAEAQKQIANINAKQAITPEGTAAWQDLENQKTHITEQAVTDRVKLNREEAVESNKAVLEAIDTVAMLAQVKAAGAADGYEAIRLQGQSELALLQQKDLNEIAQLNATLGKKSDAEMSFNEKRQAMEDLLADQDRRRKQKTVDIERQIDQTRLAAYLVVSEGMGSIFGQLYEMGGKKMKVFFVLQKAMAIATITLQAAIAAMAALAPPPIGLGPIGGQGLAAAIWAIAGANIAIVIAQTIKGMFRGGPVTKGSGARDDVPVMLTRGEFVQPEPTVRYYGTDVMEAIRRRIIPKDILRGFGFFPVSAPQFAFAGGGMVTGGGGTSISVGPINVSNGDKSLASRLRDGIEEVVVKIMRDQTR